MLTPRAFIWPLVILVALLVGGPALLEAQRSPATTTDAPRLEQVERVVDGDTLLLVGGERVRLIGVDAPESVHPSRPVERFGKEAAAFTRRLVEGQRVRLEHDPQGSARDKYGRMLAYVYLPDGTLLNLEIIRQGYGSVYTRVPFSMMERYRDAQREARDAGRGLWTKQGTPPPSRVPPPSGNGNAGKCISRANCCRVCARSRACGDGCISASDTCRKASGCACDVARLCR